MKNQEQQFNAILPDSNPNEAGSSVLDEKILSEAEIQEQSQSQHIFETADRVFFLGVDVEKGKGGDRAVSKEKFKGDVITAFDLKLMRDVAVAFKLNQPVILEGGSGIGKSRTIDRMGALLNKEVYYANCEKFDTDILIGRPDVKEGTVSGFGWRDGIVLQAIRNGGIVFLDEYNFMPGETRGGLHEVIDSILQGKDFITVARNHGERVPVHPDFRIIAAENPPGDEYGDRQVLDPAQYTRFSHIQVGEEMPTDVKKARALGRFGKDNKINLTPNDFLFSGNITEEEVAEIPGFEMIVEKYIEFTEALEKMVKNGKLAKDQPQSPAFAFQRDYDRVVGFVLTFFKGDLNETFQKALRYYYLNHFIDEGDRKKVEEMIVNVKTDIIDDTNRKGLEARAAKKAKEEKERLEREKKEAEEKARLGAEGAKEKAEADKVLEKTDEEIKALKASLRKAKKEVLGESFEPTISAEYKYKDEKGKEMVENIEIDFEQKLAQALKFYKEHGIAVPEDFAEQMKDIWEENRDEMQKQIEEFGFDEVLIIPANLKLSDAFDKELTKGYKKKDGSVGEPTYWGEKKEDIVSDSRSSKDRIILVHKNKAKDLYDTSETLPILKETLGKKGGEFKPEEGMTIEEYFVLQRQFYEEFSVYLDEKGATWLPGSKVGSQVVRACFDPADGRVHVWASDPGLSRPFIGCRPSRCFFKK